MRKNIFVGAVAIAAVVGLYVMNRHRGVSPGLRITSTEHAFAPEFSLPDLTGKTLKLSDYRGKVILLDFWAAWCEPGREEIPHFVELQSKLGDGVSISSAFPSTMVPNPFAISTGVPVQDSSLSAPHAAGLVADPESKQDSKCL